jgi:hypothetical protein
MAVDPVHASSNPGRSPPGGLLSGDIERRRATSRASRATTNSSEIKLWRQMSQNWPQQRHGSPQLLPQVAVNYTGCPLIGWSSAMEVQDSSTTTLQSLFVLFTWHEMEERARAEHLHWKLQRSNGRLLLKVLLLAFLNGAREKPLKKGELKEEIAKA